MRFRNVVGVVPRVQDMCRQLAFFHISLVLAVQVDIMKLT